MERVFILIPVLNRIKYTRECLKSFRSQTYRNFEIILIDSGSSDGTQDYVKKCHPDVIVIQGDRNWWWTRAIQEGLNLALVKADANDFILEMNNDCYFGSEYLSQLIKTAKANKKSVIGSLCVRADRPDLVVEAGIRLDWRRGRTLNIAQTYSGRLEDYQKSKLIKNLDALPGKGTLIPVSFFRAYGGYRADRLPHYVADYELTNRAKRRGYNLSVDPKAIVRHHYLATGNFFNGFKINSYVDAWRLVFSRKSMNNIFDWINFIDLAAPERVKWHNYRLVAFRLIWGISYLFPFYFFRGLYRKK